MIFCTGLLKLTIKAFYTKYSMLIFKCLISNGSSVLLKWSPAYAYVLASGFMFSSMPLRLWMISDRIYRPNDIIQNGRGISRNLAAFVLRLYNGQCWTDSVPVPRCAQLKYKVWKGHISKTCITHSFLDHCNTLEKRLMLLVATNMVVVVIIRCCKVALRWCSRDP